MIQLKQLCLYTIVFLFCYAASSSRFLAESQGQDNELQRISQQLTPVFDESVILFSHVNVKQIDLDLVEKKLGRWLDQPASGWLKPLRSIKQTLVEAGGQHVFVIFSLIDFLKVPVIAIPVSREFDAAPLIPLLESVLGQGYETKYLKSSRLLILASPDSITRIEDGLSPSRNDIEQLVESISNEVASLNFVPTPDHRRVLREFEPQFSEPFTAFDGELIGNGLQSASLILTDIQPFDLKLKVRSQNQETAAKLKQALSTVMKKIPGDGPELKFFRKLDQSLVISSDQPGLTLKIGPKEEFDWKQSIQAFFVKAKREVQQNDEVRNLRMILLGMHNFHDVFRGFPDLGHPRDKGRPELSWRVHILPFIEQAKLYEQFKLDEPWDSEHNRKLIDKMPDVYRVAGKKISEGRTTYVMPRGKGFFAKPYLKKNVEPTKRTGGRSFRDILDGTSNTIAVLRVASSNAVVWTKPDDWEPDENTLLKSIKDDDSERLLFAAADGAVHQVRWSKVTAKKMLAWLTIAGGEIASFD